MGIYIKGMEMPKNCNECKFGTWSNLHQTECCKRHDFDPCFKDHRLVEIPESHGDLIDRDALLDMVRDVNTDYYCEVLGVTVEDIYSVPTVIEAEGSEDA